MGGKGSIDICISGCDGTVIAGPQLLGYVGRGTAPDHQQVSPPRQPPRQSFTSSVGQRILTVVVALAVLRFLVALPNSLHALTNNIARDIEVSNCTLETMNKTNGYVTYTWHVVLHNTSNVNHVVTIKCDFTNGSGLAVYTDKVTEIELKAGETLDFKDNCAIPQLTAVGVTGAKVRVY